MSYSSRLQALRRALPRLKCDALVISNLTNVRYLCGFTGTAGMIVATPDAAFFITDFRYQSQAAQQLESSITTLIAERGLWSEAARRLKKLKIERIGFEAEHTSVAALEEIEKLIKPAQAISTKHAVEDLRLCKGEDEVAAIR